MARQARPSLHLAKSMTWLRPVAAVADDTKEKLRPSMFRLDLKKIRKSVGDQLTQKRAFLVVELGAVAAICYAVAQYSWPGALVLGGIVIVLAIERQPNA